jgi:hypothetical protein
MGLSIGYKLTTDLREVADVRQLVEAVRQFALDLPLEHVGEVIEITVGDDQRNYQPDGEPEDETKDQSERWLRIQSESYVSIGDHYYTVAPTQGFAFSTYPGAGSEPANFGFCTYPEFRLVEGERISTNKRGWSWTSSCKTQYASNPSHGGVPHFLRCHLAVVKILDFFQATGLAKVEVSDDGGYWEQRDLKALASEIVRWNELIAGFAGQLKDTLDTQWEAAITDFANFEHLEAKGLERLTELRRKDTGDSTEPPGTST